MHQRLKLGLTALLLVTLGVGTFFIVKRVVDSKQRAIEERASEFGINLQEPVIRSIPDDQNALTLYQAAAELLEKAKLPSAILDAYSGSEQDTAAVRTDADRFLKTIAPALDLAEQASKRELIEIKESAIPNDFPIYASIRSIVRFLLMDARKAAHKGDWPLLEKRLDAAARANGHIFNNQATALLVFVPSEATLLANLRQLSVQFRNEPEVLKIVERYAERAAPPIDLKDYVEHNLLSGLKVLDDALKDKEVLEGSLDPDSVLNTDEDMKALRWLNVPGAPKQVRTALIEASTDLVASFPKDPMDFLGYRKAFEAYDSKLEKNTSNIGKVVKFFGSISSPVDAIQTLEARRRITQIVVGMAKQTPGNAWPKVIPETPLDPFTNRPFIYRLEADGFLIYSPGLDGDQGGDIAQRGRDVGARIKNDLARR